MTVLSTAEFGELFRSCERETFRLETLSVYNPESGAENLQRYLAGEPCLKEHEPSAWMQLVADAVARGKRFYRVHVVHSPLTDHLRYEMEWGYLYNARAGEEIHILDTAERPRPQGLPGEDFWLFDDVTVVRMHYRDDGEFAWAELCDDVDVERYRGYRDLAMAHAVPFAEYWEDHPHFWLTRS